MATPSEVQTMRKCHSCEVVKQQSEFLTFAVGKRIGQTACDCTQCKLGQTYPPKQCLACGQIRMFSEFDRTAEDGLVCKACLIAAPYVYSKHCSRCKTVQPVADFNMQTRTGYRHPVCKACDHRSTRRKERLNPEVVARRRKHHLVKLKAEAYLAYGGWKCACCGETERTFLTLDHINDDGAAWRREKFGAGNSGAGLRTYEWCKKNGYPATFQILCWNCQHGKRNNGGICPHQLETCRDHPITGVGASAPKRSESGKPDYDMAQSSVKAEAVSDIPERIQ